MKYRKIHEIEAIQITDDHVLGLTPLPRGVRFIDRACHQEKRIIVRYRMELDSLEQRGVPVFIGNWIATGVKGEHWVIQDDIFRATYEPVAESLTVQPAPADVRERYARIALAERVSEETGASEDEAYNRACYDIAAAIRGDMAAPAEPEKEWRARNINPNKTATVYMRMEDVTMFQQCNADFVVQFSEDGGTTWRDVETVG